MELLVGISDDDDDTAVFRSNGGEGHRITCSSRNFIILKENKEILCRSIKNILINNNSFKKDDK